MSAGDDFIGRRTSRPPDSAGRRCGPSPTDCPFLHEVLRSPCLQLVPAGAWASSPIDLSGRTGHPPSDFVAPYRLGARS